MSVQNLAYHLNVLVHFLSSEHESIVTYSPIKFESTEVISAINLDCFSCHLKDCPEPEKEMGWGDDSSKSSFFF